MSRHPVQGNTVSSAGDDDAKDWIMSQEGVVSLAELRAELTRLATRSGGAVRHLAVCPTGYDRLESSARVTVEVVLPWSDSLHAHNGFTGHVEHYCALNLIQVSIALSTERRMDSALRSWVTPTWPADRPTIIALVAMVPLQLYF